MDSDQIHMLVSFLIFIVIVAVALLGAKWFMTEIEVSPQVRKIVLLVLGVIVLIVFLLKFLQPWLAS